LVNEGYLGGLPVTEVEKLNKKQNKHNEKNKFAGAYLFPPFYMS